MTISRQIYSPVVTIYFCGTDNMRDLSGYVISDFARAEIPEHEHINWIILNGPGSQEQQLDSWAQPRGSGPIDIGFGKFYGGGTEQNIQIALSFLLSNFDQSKLLVSADEFKKWSDEHPLHAGYVQKRALKDEYIHPFSVIAADNQVNRYHKPVRQINLIGHSRGAVAAMMLAEKLNHKLPDIPVRILAFDPVPGPGLPSSIALTPNVKQYTGVYALDERTQGFTPLFPKVDSIEIVEFIYMPGRHSTVAGNMHELGKAFKLTPDPTHALGAIHWIVYYIAYSFLYPSSSDKSGKPPATSQKWRPLAYEAERIMYDRMEPKSVFSPTSDKKYYQKIVNSTHRTFYQTAFKTNQDVYDQKVHGFEPYPIYRNCLNKPEFILSCYDYLIKLIEEKKFEEMQKTTYYLRPTQGERIPTSGFSKHVNRPVYPYVNLHHRQLYEKIRKSNENSLKTYAPNLSSKLSNKKVEHK